MGNRYRLIGAAAVFLSMAAWAASSEEEAVRKVLDAYRAAMEHRSVSELAAVVSEDLLVLEGVHKNDGWADYRDNHIGPEMAEWKEFRTAGSRLSKLEVGSDLAYAVQEATFTIVDGKGPVVLLGAETIVLGKEPKGWKIRHLHLSVKRVSPAKKP